MDILSKKERSKRMSLIRSKWTKPEMAVHKYFSDRKLLHKMHPSILGSPDITIPYRKIAIFVHGCFWHGCPKCCKIPVQNHLYWSTKIKSNQNRDKKNKKILLREGWQVIVVWEHDLKKEERIRMVLEHI